MPAGLWLMHQPATAARGQQRALTSTILMAATVLISVCARLCMHGPLLDQLRHHACGAAARGVGAMRGELERLAPVFDPRLAGVLEAAKATKSHTYVELGGPIGISAVLAAVAASGLGREVATVYIRSLRACSRLMCKNVRRCAGLPHGVPVPVSSFSTLTSVLAACRRSPIKCSNMLYPACAMSRS